jgi:hypothetical protein
LKFPYIIEQKEKFEMFRSKDFQTIIYKKLSSAISLQELRKKRVLLRDFNIHDLMSLSEIESKFTQTSVWQMIKQNYWDISPQEYGALTSIKNYLGERWGF